MRRIYTRFMRIIITVLAVPLLLAAQRDTLSIVSWNLLFFNSTKQETTNRLPSYRTVTDALDADIIVANEVQENNANGILLFLNSVLNVTVPGKYTVGTMNNTNGKDSYNAIFFKPEKVQLLANFKYNPVVRDINRFVVLNRTTQDTLHIFAIHYKAGNQATDATTRAQESDVVRAGSNALPAGTNFLILGDFNIYNSAEQAYQKLVAVTAGNEGHFIDPISMPYPANWNWSTNAPYHSQSTRVDSLPDGGSRGGMDDRFDFFLHSKAVVEDGGVKYIPGSYRPYGNNGAIYNKAVTDAANTAYSAAIKQALHDASDHLPVIARYAFSGPVNSVIREERPEIPRAFELKQNYPNPFNPETIITFSLSEQAFVTLEVVDLTGRVVATLANETYSAGNYRVKFNADGLASGTYLAVLRADASVQMRTMLLLK